MYQIKELWSYPVKSLAGIQHTRARCYARGLEYDRSWMVVDTNNNFISQRKFPKMALIQPEIEENEQSLVALHLWDKGNSQNKFTMGATDALGLHNTLMEASVWDDTVQVLECGGQVNDWLSDILGGSFRLVYFPPSSTRKVEQNPFASGSEITSLSDGYPYLLAGTASLKILEEKMGQSLDMLRFRANIIVETKQAHEEDLWQKIAIDQVNFTVAKLCARCPMPNVNPDKGYPDLDVIKTLAGFRKVNNKVIFGQNLLISNTGTISVGDQLLIS